MINTQSIMLIAKEYEFDEFNIGATLIPLGISATFGARSLQLPCGIRKRVAPAFFAAKIFSATPPILPTFALLSIVPVVATLLPCKIFSLVSNSTIPMANAKPPLGPPVFANEMSISLGFIFEVVAPGKFLAK